MSANRSAAHRSPAHRSAASPRRRDPRQLARAAEEIAELAPRFSRLLRVALDRDERAPSLEQLRVLHRIHEGFDTVSALAAVRQMRMSAISSLVDAVVARGWLTRSADEHDRRRTRLALTPSGRNALKRGRQRTSEQMLQLLDLYDGSPETLLEVIDALLEAVSEYDARSAD